MSLASASSGFGELDAWSKCPAAVVQGDFDEQKYLGTWYEMHRSNSAGDFEKGDCVSAQYSVRPEDMISVLNSEQRYGFDGKLSSERHVAEGWAKTRDPSSDLARLQVKFSKFQPVWGAYDVLYTDYETHAIVYSCVGGFWGLFQKEYHWILTRQPLDPKGSAKDAAAYKKIAESAKMIYGANFDGRDVLAELRTTMQGEKNGCKYM